MTKVSFFLDATICYTLLCLFAYYILSPFMLYVPPNATYEDDKTIIKLTTFDDGKISAVYLENPSAEYTVLYSHGNAEDLGAITPVLYSYKNQGFSVFAYDYRGYGTSDGSASEENTYQDIEAAYEYLSARVAPEKIIVLGRSLGTGPSLYLASKHKVAALVLESPFLTAFRVITRVPLFPVDRYRNNAIINKVSSPILIFHGINDEVIPFYHGKKLYEMIKQKNKKFIEVKDARHNDLFFNMGDKYFREIKSFVKGL